MHIFPRYSYHRFALPRFTKPLFARKAIDMIARYIALHLVAILASGSCLLSTASAQQQSITATVTGTLIQKVGFRAMIQKAAIMYNLAGFARNNADGTVEVRLQGDTDRIDQTIAAIRAGNKKSSQNNSVSQVPAPWEPQLKTFTVFAWTSTSRNITSPYDLVFNLRPADSQISRKDAKAVWNTIAENTLKGDDLAKFLKHLDDDD
jgi:acylphosphatase